AEEPQPFGHGRIEFFEKADEGRASATGACPRLDCVIIIHAILPRESAAGTLRCPSAHQSSLPGMPVRFAEKNAEVGLRAQAYPSTNFLLHPAVLTFSTLFSVEQPSIAEENEPLPV